MEQFLTENISDDLRAITLAAKMPKTYGDAVATVTLPDDIPAVSEENMKSLRAHMRENLLIYVLERLSAVEDKALALLRELRR